MLDYQFKTSKFQFYKDPAMKAYKKDRIGFMKMMDSRLSMTSLNNLTIEKVQQLKNEMENTQCREDSGKFFNRGMSKVDPEKHPQRVSIFFTEFFTSETNHEFDKFKKDFHVNSLQQSDSGVETAHYADCE